MKKKAIRPTNYVWAVSKRMFFASMLLTFLLTGCKKELPTSLKGFAVKGSTNAIFPYSFNWEDPNINWWPYPSNTITPPWVGSGSLFSNLDPDVLNDRKASDGWVLVYNTFDPTSVFPNPYFILYNKYRGLLRIYLYINNVSSIAPSSYLQDGITTFGYKFLNFAGSDIVDVSKTNYRFDKVEPAPQDGSKPFTPNRWYMLQYEMAYDPQLIPSTSPNPPQFSFYANAVNIDSVKLGGTQQGTLNGTIGSSASPSNLFSTIANDLGKPLGTGVLAAVGTSFFNNHESGTLQWANNDLGLNNDVFSSISKGLSGALSTATGNLPGAITNIFSAIIGGSSASTQPTVSLNLSTTISLKGSILSNSNFIAPTSFYMPGSIMADANGNYQVQSYIPLYNQPLGVFNLANRPTINAVETITSKQVSVGTLYDINVSYSISNVSIQWNPAVTNIATISNLTYEVVLVPYSTMGLLKFLGLTSTGRSESLSGIAAYTRQGSISAHYSTLEDIFLPPGACEKNVYVRVSFNVVPKDGSPTSTIVKTFVANIIRTTK